MKEALGLIEVKGLAAAITIADTMAKVASVQLWGIEKARGNGWMTVKITGNVGAVKAAIDAGVAKANESQVYIAEVVIPRTGEGLSDQFLKSKDTKSTEIESNKKDKTVNKESSKGETTKKKSSKGETTKKESSKGKTTKKESSKGETPKKKSSKGKTKTTKKKSGKAKTTKKETSNKITAKNK